MKRSIRSLRIATLPLALSGLMASHGQAAPLLLTQTPQATVKEPPPNVVMTIDDSASLGYEGLTAIQSALKATFTEQLIPDGTIRLAWQSLNRCRRLPLSATTDASCGAYNGMRLIDKTHRANLTNWIDNLTLPVPSNTPSHLAMKRVFDYFSAKGDYNPWRNNPQTPTDLSELSCRKSFHVFMTDGSWNSLLGSSKDGDGVVMGGGNADGTPRTLPDGVKYDTASAQTRFYRDTIGTSEISTFSDLAFHMWATDLRNDLANDVKFRQNVGTQELYGTAAIAPYWNPKNNPASWQHIVTYTIGFKGAADKWTGPIQWAGGMYSGIDKLAQGEFAWTSPLCGSRLESKCTVAQGVNDTVVINRRKQELWHAAMNGRGVFFPAPDNTALAAAFQSILADIRAEGIGGVVSVAANKRDLRQDALVYLASFSPEYWAGDISARGVRASDTSLSATASWSAAARLDLGTVNVNARLIKTHDGTRGTDFVWTALTPAQKSLIQGAGTEAQGRVKLDYLRGDRSNEQTATGGTLRTRGSRLGTIVNSNLWAQTETPPYPVEFPGHASFRKLTRDRNRSPMLMVGANDGMFHVFNAKTGDEILAYVPSGVYSKLDGYTDPRYKHQYTVDGSPFAGDVDVSSSAVSSGIEPSWKTYAVAPLGAGGRGYAIVDVTSTELPALQLNTLVVLDNSSSSTSTSQATQDPDDIGHIVSPPTTDPIDARRADQFVKLNNGRWAVLLGNGVNSVRERASLLVQYLDGSRELLVIPAQSGTGLGNGLAAPRPLDVDGNGTADVVYAGDLLGNFWKFDLTRADPTQWGVAGWGSGSVCKPGGSTVCQPLMTAVDAAGKAQSITTAPMWVPHPLGGVVLNFGTGRLLEETDRDNKSVQSLYGVWDSTRYSRSGGIVTASTGPNVAAGTLRSRLVQQTITGQVAKTSATTDLRNYFNTSRNPVLYTQNASTSPRGWYIDLPPTGERLLGNPTLRPGNLVRFETRVPAETFKEGTCSTVPPPELGFLMVVKGLTGEPAAQPVFHTTDSTLDLSNASRVQFGAGESVAIETAHRTVVFGLNNNGNSTASQSTAPSVQLNRFTYIPRRIDWRILP
ncbi:pilus assembly protein [uncultured Hydrogenophaga sp.]|uniref:pilus assembly protein n=1 Tax=uncultured Hydrogenophaga sp. TaxID=199683 RepID=UPI00265DD9FB|nr:PilC/PilY family type IV pilus protein [uncultured Hydrogenophaga sp.]